MSLINAGHDDCDPINRGFSFCKLSSHAFCFLKNTLLLSVSLLAMSSSNGRSSSPAVSSVFVVKKISMGTVDVSVGSFAFFTVGEGDFVIRHIEVAPFDPNTADAGIHSCASERYVRKFISSCNFPVGQR